MPGTQPTPIMPAMPEQAACASVSDAALLRELVRRDVMWPSLANLIAKREIRSKQDIDDLILESSRKPEADDFVTFGPIIDATEELRGGRRAEACHRLELILPREWQGVLA